MKTIFKYCSLLMVLVFIGTNTRAAIISVRLIKAKISRCSETPTLRFLSFQNDYSMVNKKWYNGETAIEIFFEIETKAYPFPKAKLAIYAPGVEVVKALVGKTYVPFEKQGDEYIFQVVADTTDGRHVSTDYKDPKGGAGISIYHNWKARMSGSYLEEPYPEKALAASANYTLACQEMLRLMGNMNGEGQRFNGEFQLLTCESSAPRAHLDFPAHWHLEHWEHDYDSNKHKLHRKKQYIIPHYFLDSAGNILKNKIGITQNYKKVRLAKTVFLPGDTCVWNDAEGNLIFKQIIKDGSLEFVKQDGQVWSLRPDKEKGGSESVWIYRSDTPVASASLRDDGEHGIASMKITYYENGCQTDVWNNSFRYDPYTGIVIK